MDLKEFKATIRELATISETTDDVYSCYLDLTAGKERARLALQEAVRQVRAGLSPTQRDDLIDVVDAIVEELEQVTAQDRGMAVFARRGDEPLRRVMRFQVPLPSWLGVAPTPNLYHLVELKDTYHRFVVLLCEPELVRILEVNLGAVTAQTWKDRPEIRERVGTEWSQRQYRRRRRERDQRFVRQAIEALERRVEAGGYAHLMLAGNAKMIRAVRNALPPALEQKLVDSVTAGASYTLQDVIEATMGVFVDETRRESLTAVEELLRELRTGGLGLVGAEEVLEAIRHGQVDAVLIERRYAGPLRAELTRQAMLMGTDVELVDDSDVLMELGGVGALLRYRVSMDLPATLAAAAS